MQTQFPAQARTNVALHTQSQGRSQRSIMRTTKIKSLSLTGTATLLLPLLAIFSIGTLTAVTATIGENVAQLFEASDHSAVFSPPTVGVFYYPWYGGNDFHGGNYMRKLLQPRQQPALGEYDDSLPETISQHLTWSRRANVKVWFTSWWGPGELEDNTIRNVILDHDEIGDHKIAILYETTGRIMEAEGWNPSRVESDARYLCENYFNHPNYYKINGKPVIFAYLTRQLPTREVLQQFVESFRNNCDQELFILGDQVWQTAPGDGMDYMAFNYLDGITNYDIYGNTNTTPYATQEVVDRYYDDQATWRERAGQHSVRYIPNTSPGYNDRGVRIDDDHFVLSRSLSANDKPGSLFVAQLKRARELTDPDADHLLLVNSFNEWHEDTQIEPASGRPTTMPFNVTDGLVYRGYGTLYLDILHAATCTEGSNCNEDHHGKPDEFDYSKGPADDGPSSGFRDISFDTTDSPFDGPPPANITVGAYYYAWYGDEDFNKTRRYIREDLSPPHRPMLGEYDVRDAAVLDQHFAWSRKANINMWATPWQNPGSIADTTILDHIMVHPSIGDHKIALLYQVVSRIVFAGKGVMGIGNDASNLAPDFSLVQDDISYICQKYFAHGNYYTVNDRPVLFLSISRVLYERNILEETVSAIRDVAHRLGHDVFLIGDQVWSDPPQPNEQYEPFLHLDAVTNRDVYGNLGVAGYAGQRSVDEFYVKQMHWRDRAWDSRCRFVPSVIAGFNKGIGRILSRRLTADSDEGSLFYAGVEKARHLVDPVVNNLIMVNSFNQWQRDTQIEPVIGVRTQEPQAVTQGTVYEGYGELYLDILQQLTAQKKAARISQMTPLGCNSESQFDESQCVTWSSQFDNQEEYLYKVVIPCGRCVIMDLTYKSVALKKGLEVLGKLVIPEELNIDVSTLFLTVEGDLVAPGSS